MEHQITELISRDLPAVVELCRVALDLPEDAAEAEQIVTVLREGGETPGLGPRRTVGLAAVHDGAVVGAALGSISHREPAVGHVDLVAVLPRCRRQGIGRALLTRIEMALAGLGADEVQLAGNPPYYAWPGIDVRYTPAVCTAMALGYEHGRTAWNMTADLSESDEDSPWRFDIAPDERRLAERGITVRAATPADVAILAEFARENFNPVWGVEVAHSVRHDAAGCHLAVGAGGEILGFAAYGWSRPSWFGPMGTAAAARGLGIGVVLLRRCLRDLRSAGHLRAQIGWVGPVPFYAAKAGARIERVFFLFNKKI